MTTTQAKELLWAEYETVPNETLEELIKLIQSVCAYVLATEPVEDHSDHINHENHELT